MKYKFKNWDFHSKDPATPVTPEQKETRAAEIAEKLCNHRDWLTHGRSIKIQDLESSMGLRITDYAQDPPLAEAIRRYHTLLHMTFDNTTIYKIFETPQSQIIRLTTPINPAGPTAADVALFDLQCNKCRTVSKIQANLEKKPIAPGHHPFPSDNRFRCPACGNFIYLRQQKRDIEKQTGKPLVF